MVTAKSLEETVRYLKTKFQGSARAAIVLGSGLGGFATRFTDRTTAEASSIPNYPAPTVAGHAGKVIFGRLQRGGRKSAPIIALQGRVHFYESGSYEPVLYPILVLHLLGVRKLILTNAAGAINKLFCVGDLMLITDYINMTLENPLRALRRIIGTVRGTPFPFSPDLTEKAEKVALNLQIPIHKGVYIGVKGPSYETAAEIEAFRRIGADVVGMSTVPEAMLASSLGMEVLGVSLITNYATGISGNKLSHEDVTVAAAKARKRFTMFMTQVLEELA